MARRESRSSRRERRVDVATRLDGRELDERYTESMRSFGAVSACLLVFGLVPALTRAQPLDAVEADRARIREHLSRVQEELRAVDTSGMSEARRAARAQRIEALHAYAKRGVFPRNTGHPGTTHPYFIDLEGRSCAVAHLMIDSGAGQLADAVQRDHGVDYVADMGTPGIGDWAELSGLTVAELAAIQPGYCNCETEPQFDPVCGTNGLSYWNRCVAELCGGMEIAYAGACAEPAVMCEPPYVVGCGFGISYGLCEPTGGGDADPVWQSEAAAWVADPVCPQPAGCSVAPPGRRSGTAARGFGLVLFALLGLGRRRGA